MLQKIQEIQSTVKSRAILVCLIVHMGLICGLYAVAKLSIMNGWDPTTITLLAGILCLYGGFLLALFFVLAPVWPWIRRAQQAEHWITLFLKDLPLFLEHLPKIVAAIESLIHTWNETRVPKKTKSKEE